MRKISWVEHHGSTLTTPLIGYASILFFIYLADALMSYVAPVFIQQQVADTLIMGIILASSSAMGIICDSLFPSILQSKHHSFFIWTTICLALLFPAIFLFFPHYVGMLFVAMLIWGVYFELLMFANSYFVEAFMRREQHSLAWGVINTFRSLSMFVAPLIAPWLLDQGHAYPLWLVIFLLVVALTATTLFRHLYPHEQHVLADKEVVARRTLHQELRIWKTIFHRVWPLYLMLFSIVLLEATMMSVGVLATEDLRHKSIVGGLFLAVFILPNIFTGLVIQPLSRIFGKKALAFLAGTLGGGLLALAVQLPDINLMILTTLVAACFTSLTYPAVLATMQDYTTRLGVRFGREMVGMTSSAGSLAFIVGPILAGGISHLAGNTAAISVVALFLMGVSTLCLIVVSRKIRMPQHVLTNLS